MGDLTKKDDDVSAQGQRVLALIRQEFPNYHPILAIARLAHDADIEDPRIVLECHKTIARYVTPELKSVEVKATVTEHRRVVVSMFDGEPIDMGGAAQVVESVPQLTEASPALEMIERIILEDEVLEQAA